MINVLREANMDEVTIDGDDKDLAFFQEFRDFVLDVLDCIDVRLVSFFLSFLSLLFSLYSRSFHPL